MATLKMMPDPIFLMNQNALYKSFQMRYHLFQKFFEKVVKIKETSFLLSKCLVSIGQHCNNSKGIDIEYKLALYNEFSLLS